MEFRIKDNKSEDRTSTKNVKSTKPSSRTKEIKFAAKTIQWDWKILSREICCSLNSEAKNCKILQIDLNSIDEVDGLLKDLPAHVERNFSLPLMEGRKVSTISYEIQNKTLKLFITSPGTKDFFLYGITQRSGATTVPLPIPQWLEYVKNLTPSEVAWEIGVIKSSVLEDKTIPASTAFPQEGKQEYKQPYRLKYTGKELKEMMQSYVSPFLKAAQPISLCLGIHEKTRTVIGVPISQEEQQQFTTELQRFLLASFFPPIPKDFVSISWQRVTVSMGNSATHWYEIEVPKTDSGDKRKSDVLLKPLDEVFLRTCGRFKLYHQPLSSEEKFFIETQTDLPTLTKIEKPKVAEEQPRFLITIHFHNNGQLYAHTKELEYWYYDSADKPCSLDCFEWWMLQHSKHVDPVAISLLHSSLCFRVLLNCTEEEFHESQFFKNVRIDGNSRTASPNSLQTKILAIFGLDKSTTSTYVTQSIQKLLQDYPTKNIMVFFFVREAPKLKIFPDIQRYLTTQQIPWDILYPNPNWDSSSLLPPQRIETHNCATVVTEGPLLSQDELNALAQNYFRGYPIDPTYYWTLARENVLIERNLAKTLRHYIDTSLTKEETSVITIHKKYHSCGATSLMHYLAYYYYCNGSATPLLLNPKADADMEAFNNSVSNSASPVILFIDELNCDAFRMLNNKNRLAIVLVVITRNPSDPNRCFVIEPFLDCTEASAMINACNKYFPKSVQSLDFLSNKLSTPDCHPLDRHMFTLVLTAHQQIYTSAKNFVTEQLKSITDAKTLRIAHILAFLAVYTTKMSPGLILDNSPLKECPLFISSGQMISFWNVWLARESMQQLWEQEDKISVISTLFVETFRALKPTPEQKLDFLSDILFSHKNMNWSRLYNDLKEKPGAYDELLERASKWFIPDLEDTQQRAFEAHKLLHNSRILRLQDNKKALKLAQEALENARSVNIPDFPFLENLAEAYSHNKNFQMADSIFDRLFADDPKKRTIDQALNNARLADSGEWIIKWTARAEKITAHEVAPIQKSAQITFSEAPELVDSLE